MWDRVIKYFITLAIVLFKFLLDCVYVYCTAELISPPGTDPLITGAGKVNWVSLTHGHFLRWPLNLRRGEHFTPRASSGREGRIKACAPS